MSRKKRLLAKNNNHAIAKSQLLELPDSLIAAALLPFGIEPSEPLAAAIRQYVQLLIRWNQKISLTSITEPEQILRRHFGESMFAAHAVPISGGHLVDVGSGAGFPGLALKLMSPGLDVTLIEPNLKKSAFLAEAARSLEMKSVRVLSRRIEEISVLDGAADYVTCRAVRPDKRLLHWSRGVLARNGRCVLWLGQEDAATLLKGKDWSWEKPIPIPLSSHRVLLIGRPGSI